MTNHIEEAKSLLEAQVESNTQREMNVYEAQAYALAAIAEQLQLANRIATETSFARGLYDPADTHNGWKMKPDVAELLGVSESEV